MHGVPDVFHRCPQGTTATLGISTVPLQPGTFTNTANVFANNPNFGTTALDPPLVTTVLPNLNPPPPVLTLQVASPQSLRLSLSGQAEAL